MANKINSMMVFISLQYCDNQAQFIERLNNYFTSENYKFWIDNTINRIYNIKISFKNQQGFHFINLKNLELKSLNELKVLKDIQK